MGKVACKRVYVSLYRYLDDFVALYLTYGLRCIISNDISL
jgi:hypothetical protein